MHEDITAFCTERLAYANFTGALRNGDEPAVYKISTPLCALVSMQNSLDAFLAIEKYLLVKQGVFRNTVIRGPVGYMLDDETRREIDRLFDLLMATL